MRLDKRLVRDGLTTRQVFFIECWGSLSHKDSIDTDRVSFNNILNALKELMYLYRYKVKYNAVEKRTRAAEELYELLEHDRVLARGAFQGIPAQIKSLIVSKNQLKDSGRSIIEKNYSLMESLITHLVELLETSYIKEALVVLEELLEHGTDPTDDELGDISDISNRIMSFMLTLGMPLSECYLLYQRILLGKNIPEFHDRFNSWKDKISSPMQPYTVTLIMENDRLHEMLLVNNPPVKFNGCTYTPFTTIKNKKATSIEIKTEGISVLSARVRADSILTDSLDVVAYMIGNGDINIHKSFNVADKDGIAIDLQGFENEINVNQDRLTLREFSHFINSIRKLCDNSSDASLKKISSAFHFLRNGVCNRSKESRFTSFWSALESLTLGVSSKDNIGHDEHVIYSVVPCMGMDYVVKQMVAVRGIIRYLNLYIRDEDGQRIDFVNADLATLYTNLKNANTTRQLLDALAPYPYAKYMLNKLIQLCITPRDLGNKIIRHAEKVTLHIHRLYILRNSIVHNADSSPYIDILTANLEHYLRGVINAMFYTASAIPKIRSPEEAFVRYHFMYDSLVKELEPTYGVTKDSEIKSINNQIGNGGITPSDDKVVEWLKLHV